MISTDSEAVRIPHTTTKINGHEIVVVCGILHILDGNIVATKTIFGEFGRSRCRDGQMGASGA